VVGITFYPALIAIRASLYDTNYLTRFAGLWTAAPAIAKKWKAEVKGG